MIKRLGDIPREALEWNPAGSRKVGRPTSVFKVIVREELRGTRMTWERSRIDASNCVNWRTMGEVYVPEETKGAKTNV